MCAGAAAGALAAVVVVIVWELWGRAGLGEEPAPLELLLVFGVGCWARPRGEIFEGWGGGLVEGFWSV